MTATFHGIGRQVLYANLTNLNDSETSAPIASESINSKLDRTVPMVRMRNNFAKPGPGLLDPRNRTNLVAEFYELSKSVIDGKINVEDFVETTTFKDLERSLEHHIDILSNNQVVNILASLIKMSVNPSKALVKLLEHEIKFRIRQLSLSQVVKLIKIYDSNDMSYEQKQISDILNNRIRSIVDSDTTSVIGLVEVLGHLSSQVGSTNLLSLVEEKLLNALLSGNDPDDVVRAFLPANYDYQSLCNIFVELAARKRRPTPLLKATSVALTKLPRPIRTESQENVLLLISTLKSLIDLSYHQPSLIAKLVADITDTIRMEQHDPSVHCSLLRTIAGLRWRSIKLLKLYYDYVHANRDNPSKVDHNMLMSLVHITALLNYKPEVDLKVFYSDCMTPEREKMVNKKSRKWLNHVWSLTMLGIADEEHMNSVLNDKYIDQIRKPSSQSPISHGDTMKLLNLRAIAKFEHRLSNLDCTSLVELSKVKIQRSSEMQKYASKIREALNGIITSDLQIRHEVATPYGFIVDCEILLNENMDLIQLEWSLDKAVKSAEDGKWTAREEATKSHHCALIYVLFDETIATSPTEVIGNKRVIKRILKNLGYNTVFLPENLLNREKTSADLCNKIREIMNSTIAANSEKR